MPPARLLALALALALPSPSLAGGKHEAELKDLTTFASVLKTSQDSYKLNLLYGGANEFHRDHNWPHPGCGELYKGLRQISDPELKPEWVARNYEGCKLLCPSGKKRMEAFNVLAMVGPDDKARVLIEACDEEGEDPVFTGETKALRLQMPLWDYLAVRAIFVQIEERLLKTIKGPEAEALWKEFQEVIPEIARLLSTPTP